MLEIFGSENNETFRTLNIIGQDQALMLYKNNSCSTQLSMKFILLMNVKMPTIVGILTFISMINTTSERLKKQETSLFVGILLFMCIYYLKVL